MKNHGRRVTEGLAWIGLLLVIGQAMAHAGGAAEKSPAAAGNRESSSAGQWRALSLITDGKVVHSIEGDGCDLTFKWPDASGDRGRHWYLLKVIQEDREMAWTSPVWLSA